VVLREADGLSVAAEHGAAVAGVRHVQGLPDPQHHARGRAPRYLALAQLPADDLGVGGGEGRVERPRHGLELVLRPL
jgi:hypothetical protein